MVNVATCPVVAWHIQVFAGDLSSKQRAGKTSRPGLDAIHCERRGKQKVEDRPIRMDCDRLVVSNIFYVPPYLAGFVG